MSPLPDMASSWQALAHSDLHGGALGEGHGDGFLETDTDLPAAVPHGLGPVVAVAGAGYAEIGEDLARHVRGEGLEGFEGGCLYRLL